MLYTIGYTGLNLDVLVSFLTETDAKLVDIRFSPRSRNPAYSRMRLEKRLGVRYRHLSALGNVNYKGGSVRILDYQGGKAAIQSLLATFQALVLLCVCKDVTLCHRKGVAERLSVDLGVGLEHLTL